MIRFDALAAAVVMTVAAAGAAFGGDMPPRSQCPRSASRRRKGFTAVSISAMRCKPACTVPGCAAMTPAATVTTASVSTRPALAATMSPVALASVISSTISFVPMSRATCSAAISAAGFRRLHLARMGQGEPDVPARLPHPSRRAACSPMPMSISERLPVSPPMSGGVGATRVIWGDVRTTSACVGCSSEVASSARSSGDADWRFTYALMAGLAYQLSPNVKLDLGYRYSHVAGGDMFGSSAANTAAGATGAMARQEIRVGLRVTTW